MPRGPSPASENVFLALVESSEVLKLYKCVFDIQRLVDPPIWKLLSRGEWKMRMGRLVPINPYYERASWIPGGGGVE